MTLVLTPSNVECLPAKEAIKKFREEKIEPLHDTYRLWDHEDLKNLYKRAGQWMHSSELIYKVQKLNPLVFVEQQINYPDEWGFYTGVLGKKKYVSGFTKGWLREFSAIEVDARNLQTGDELRGWRTVLLRLLSLGVIQWKETHKVFGDSEGINSIRWQQYTMMYRHECAEAKISNNKE